MSKNSSNDSPITESYGIVKQGQKYSLTKLVTDGKRVMEQKVWDAEPKDVVYARLRNEIVYHFIKTTSIE